MHRKSEDIQVLRGIAILLVLAVHWSLGTLVFQRLGLNNPGWIGVELFFVVSGFVVVRSFERSAFDLGRFANARAFRLFPALALMLALALVANPVLPGVTPAEALGHLWTDQRTLLGQSLAVLLGFHPSAAFGQSYTNGALWSLSKEFQFYAALALAAGLLKAALRDQAALRRGVFALALAVYAAGALSRALLYFGATTWAGNILMGGKFDLMALGVVAGMLPQGLLRATARRARPAAPVLLAAPLLALMLSRDPHAGTGAGDLLENVLMVLVGWAFVLLVVAASEEGLSWALPRPVRRFVVLAGDRSYTLFLFHFPCYMASFYVATYVYMPPLGGDWSWPVTQFVVSILIMLPLVEGVYRWVELPMIEVGRRWLEDRRPPAEQAAGAAAAGRAPEPPGPTTLTLPRCAWGNGRCTS